jgi:FkbM family methyltransferase
MHVLCVLNQGADLARVVDTLRELTVRQHSVTVAWPTVEPAPADALPAAVAVTGWDASAAQRHRRAAKAVQLALAYLRHLEVDVSRPAADVRVRTLGRLLQLVSGRVVEVPKEWAAIEGGWLAEERERLRLLLQATSDSLRQGDKYEQLLSSNPSHVVLLVNPRAQSGVAESGRRMAVPIVPFPDGEPPVSAEIVSLLEQEAKPTGSSDVASPGPPGNSPPAAAEHAGSPREPIRVDFPETEIWLQATSAVDVRRASACAKEPWTVQWLQDAVGAGEVLYDIGANVGVFSLIAARHCRASVIAFEPGYATFARLCENIQLNRCEASIVPISLPLAERNGLVALRYRHLDAGQSRHTLTTGAWRPRDTVDEHYVQPICAVTLDTMVATFDLPQPQHLKIDVDGAEVRVLRGATAVLHSPALRTVLIEVGAELWDAVHGLLAGAGLELAWKKDRDQQRTKPLYAMFQRQV